MKKELILFDGRLDINEECGNSRREGSYGFAG
jgi:hypothetical protein